LAKASKEERTLDGQGKRKQKKTFR
jgi:hypothetical protein